MTSFVMQDRLVGSLFTDLIHVNDRNRVCQALNDAFAREHAQSALGSGKEI